MQRGMAASVSGEGLRKVAAAQCGGRRQAIALSRPGGLDSPAALDAARRAHVLEDQRRAHRGRSLKSGFVLLPTNPGAKTAAVFVPAGSAVDRRSRKEKNQARISCITAKRRSTLSRPWSESVYLARNARTRKIVIHNLCNPKLSQIYFALHAARRCLVSCLFHLQYAFASRLDKASQHSSVPRIIQRRV